MIARAHWFDDGEGEVAEGAEGEDGATEADHA
jgi:hypothetical protein